MFYDFIFREQRYKKALNLYKENEELGFFVLDSIRFIEDKLKKKFLIFKKPNNKYLLIFSLEKTFIADELMNLNSNIISYDSDYICIYDYYRAIKKEHDKYLKYFYYTSIQYHKHDWYSGVLKIDVENYNKALDLYIKHLETKNCIINIQYISLVKIQKKPYINILNLPEDVVNIINSYYDIRQEYYKYFGSLRSYIINGFKPDCIYTKIITKDDYIFEYMHKILKDHGIHTYISMDGKIRMQNLHENNFYSKYDPSIPRPFTALFTGLPKNKLSNKHLRPV